MSLPTPNLYYSFNIPDKNLYNNVQNWATGFPVYDASLNNAYISRQNYYVGNGSLHSIIQFVFEVHMNFHQNPKYKDQAKATDKIPIYSNCVNHYDVIIDFLALYLICPRVHIFR
jgi:hypothetical protein